MCFTFKNNIKRTKKPVNQSFLAGWCKCRYTVSADLYCNKTLPNAKERILEAAFGSTKNLSLGVDDQKEIKFLKLKMSPLFNGSLNT